METIFTAVTPDEKEFDINKVKVREEQIIPEADLATIQKYNPTFVQPDAKMHRLELIDEELVKLEKQKADVQVKIDEQQLLRAKVLEAAQKVILVKAFAPVRPVVIEEILPKGKPII